MIPYPGRIKWGVLLSGWDAVRQYTLFCELVTGYRVRPPITARIGKYVHNDCWDPRTMRWRERPAAVQERLL